jgi:hypothetical protein
MTSLDGPRFHRVTRLLKVGEFEISSFDKLLILKPSAVPARCHGLGLIGGLDLPISSAICRDALASPLFRFCNSGTN